MFDRETLIPPGSAVNTCRFLILPVTIEKKDSVTNEATESFLLAA
jgi:hypothetical protein